MPAPPSQVPLLFEGAAAGALPTPDAVRGQRRRDEIQIVEYAPFPRLGDQPGRVGFTRDVSESGLCACVDSPVREGALIRVRLRDVTGRIEREAIARVAWSERPPNAHRRLGLQLQARR